jgi:hypothetical protein
MARQPQPVSRELFRYDQMVVNQINRIEDRVTKFALQNYTSSGAVLLAFFTTKIPLLAAAAVVFILNFNFVLAIASHLWRFKVLYAMHDVTRNHWLEDKLKSELIAAFKADKDCKKVLEIRTASPRDRLQWFDWTHPAAWGSWIPTVAVTILLLLEYWGIPSRPGAN